MEHTDRLKLFEFSKREMLNLFEDGHTVEISNGIPSDAEINECGYDRDRQLFYLTMEHESFEPVGLGERIPIGDIVVTELGDDDE